MRVRMSDIRKAHGFMTSASATGTLRGTCEVIMLRARLHLLVKAPRQLK